MMDTYSILREIADSWVLLGMFGFFISAAIWAFLPSQAGARKDAQMIPFRNETIATGCQKSCKGCGEDTQALSAKGAHHG